MRSSRRLFDRWSETRSSGGGMAQAALDPWTISEAAFPQAGTPAQKLRFLLNYAILAPSGHNSQPWVFRIAAETLELYADRTRALPVVDPEDRELTISCGGALFNLRAALRYFGYIGAITLLPKRTLPDLLACVRLGEREAPSADERALFHAITRRHTNRLPFRAQQLSGALLFALEVAVAEEGAWLHLVEGDEARNAVADLVAEGDRRLMANPQFRRELASWVHSSRGRSRDGMPGYALGYSELTDFVTPVMSLAIRALDLGDERAAKDRHLAIRSPAIVVIGTDANDAQSWLTAGQAMERLLLRACADGVFASYLNQPIQVPALRPRLSEVIGRRGFPQLVLRLGYDSQVKPTPRRRLSEAILD